MNGTIIPVKIFIYTKKVLTPIHRISAQSRLVTRGGLFALSFLLLAVNTPSTSFLPYIYPLLLENNASTQPSTPQAMNGFESVTTAIEATGAGVRYDVGGPLSSPNRFTELSGVPWQSLQPGDVVNIHYRANPYRHKILLSEKGSQAHPIIINGVTNTVGLRPTIDANNAVTINPQEWDTDYASALLLINKRHATGQYGNNAQHYVIQNLRLTGVRGNNQYSHAGVAQYYPDFGRAIWSAGGQHIKLQGMIIEDNNSGIFIQASDDPGTLSRNWTISGSKFENNGLGNRHHQIYFQAVSKPESDNQPAEYNIVEGNYFGPPTPGQQSIAQLKMRSTGVIVRYNWFNSSHRTLDIVEAQDAIPNWMYANYSPAEILEYYRSSYIYGNIFVMDATSNGGQIASRPLHFGADSLEHDALFEGHGIASGKPGMRGVGAPTYFYHNTLYMHATQYRGDLFDTENNNSTGPTPTPGKVDAWNNIISFAGTSRIGVMNRSGTTHWRGANLVFTDTLTTYAESDAYANFEVGINDIGGDDPDVHIFYDGLILNAAPNFVDADNIKLSAKNFNLDPSSPAIGAAVSLPNILSIFPVLLQISGTQGGAAIRSATNDLGALESN